MRNQLKGADWITRRIKSREGNLAQEELVPMVPPIQAPPQKPWVHIETALFGCWLLLPERNILLQRTSDGIGWLESWMLFTNLLSRRLRGSDRWWEKEFWPLHDRIAQALEECYNGIAWSYYIPMHLERPIHCYKPDDPIMPVRYETMEVRAWPL